MIMKRVLVSALAVTVIVLSASGVDAQEHLSASAETLKATLNDPSSLDIEFRITVGNDEEWALAGVAIVLPDTEPIDLGDFQPEEKKTTGTITLNVDPASLVSHNVPVELKLTFSIDGATTEVSRTVIVSATTSPD